MEHKSVPKSCMILSEAKDDNLCAMYFGISCSIFALKHLSEKSLKSHKCSEIRDELLLGSANLLGMLVSRVQKCELYHKLEFLERENIELKRIRSEDSKANEKVASIYASQEQSWFLERRKLRNQVGTLLNDLRILDRRKSETISELNEKVEEMSFSVKSKEKILEEVEKKRKELEEKVKSMEDALEELREKTKCEAEEHSSELLKQKTAFIELVSNQRQLEAELGRALRQEEATKEELDYVFEEKEEAVLMVQEMTVEIERMRKESEWKDRILSVMMRKSKLDEAKLLKSRNDSENDRWRAVPGSKIGRRTLRNMLSRQNSRLEGFSNEREDDYVSTRDIEVDRTNLDLNDDVLDDFGAQCEDCSLLNKKIHYKCCHHDEAIELDEWEHFEAERYHNAFEKRHQLELDSITEQMHLKEDKLEACRWRLLSAEVKSKKLQSQIEGLNNNLVQLRHDNFKLETLLLDREVELKTLKDQITLQLNHLNAEKVKAKLVKKRSFNKVKAKKDLAELEVKNEEKSRSVSKDSSSTFLSPAESINEKELVQELHPYGIEISSFEGLKTRKEDADKLCLNRKDGSSWKVDINALGVSYKIKRLNQQLLMLDRLTGMQESGEIQKNEEHKQVRTKGFSMLLSLLNKQVSRYQSLQEKTDDLSKRMGEKELNLKQRGSNSKRTKEETRKLEQFLEETFQLQRFIVATGQKLIEIQSKIASGLDGIAKEFDGYASFDMKRFTETIQSLFKDVQRGLEVHVSQILGDLGGTLTCDGIHFSK